MKRNKVIFSSLLILLPSFLGLLMWNKLPESLPTHFDFAGEADGFSSRGFAVIALPLILLAVHFVMTFALAHDPKRDNINGKLSGICLWICPAVSVLFMGIIFSKAMGMDVPVSHLTLSLIGLLFVIIGNYLPKCQMNYTVGIKLPWTLNDSENWRRTHRMAGPLWILGGFVMMTVPFFGNAGTVIFLFTVTAMVVLPALYSYRLYKKSL